MFGPDRHDVFWIVGSGLKLRHATKMRPGAAYSGQQVPTLCDDLIKVPQATPSGREPNSKSITERCPQCSEEAERCGFSTISWDF
ncbi:hypothetical protein A8924_0140 [Saccharopolyspora erythraea NRRL 2338]|uniref:Uncharacterized protein n=2 Tax=Saccharopolyspora erythraea TaxID=1836 RepID=A4FQI8_SACEN|nr:hypothetical protein [Saccharopolyspora erythraea]EQD86600.1 hypothetical protein N599_08455 [Saccharopolyspora erythraea D]PFG92916.1 hypothetical protein A8924_0140 [Saccharopolyspora erythraea NRRL 2338]QRK89816.1 hypothetical protein JQX30_35835 [Saccharopolyspora erythraea]CAM06313.1 hypothetical protein SACE_7155 [Saccharopolyspora erythraea NRRL 2338]